ncbi:MAG TPA: MurT ligase domain-containing protein [Actinomycetota bacterium]|nr:MurT ligase domain-containing protein [Actinomycetota bacterium]
MLVVLEEAPVATDHGRSLNELDYPAATVVPAVQAAIPAQRGHPAGSGRRRAADRLVARGVRLARRVIRLTGRGRGATLPGLLAERCAPGIAGRWAAHLERVVLVSGTNGKTTTTALLSGALAGAGRRVATNASGSNLHRGLVTALLCADQDAQDAVLEVDEAVLPGAIEQLRPVVVALLNLSRDQLDRHHEVGGLGERWRAAMAHLPAGATVVANAGDARVAHIAEAAPRAVLVGMPGARRGRDDVACPRCGALLVEGPGGAPRCRRCEWAPMPVAVEVWRRHAAVRVRGLGLERRAQLPVGADGYALDAATAWTAATLLGVDPTAAWAAVTAAGTVQGRYAERRWQDVSVRLLLAKNPAGWDEALVAAADRRRAAVVAVNGFGPDGRDTSWLWDVGMARLRDRPRVVATGARAEDVALRLEVAGVGCAIVRPLAAAITGARAEAVDLFADYTSFQAARRLLGDG